MALSVVCVLQSYQERGLGAEIVRRTFGRIHGDDFDVSCFKPPSRHSTQNWVRPWPGFRGEQLVAKFYFSASFLAEPLSSCLRLVPICRVMRSALCYGADSNLYDQMQLTE
jgi:hypothetical protein